MTTRTRGFSLVELLVVIAIIGILAAMVFPAFARARESARKVSCLSRVKQLATAVMMYTADYDDRFPIVAYLPPSGAGQPAPDSPLWPAYIAPYCPNHDVFVCPDCGEESYYADTWKDRSVLSIGLNHDLQDRFTNLPYPASVFAEPARTILLADSSPPSEELPAARARGFQVTADRRPDTQAGVGCRHFKGTNVGFIDGHAQWFVAERIWQLDNPAGLFWKPYQGRVAALLLRGAEHFTALEEHMLRKLVLALSIALLIPSLARAAEEPVPVTDAKVVRCAVIGGMTMTGLWQAITKRFEAQSDYRIQVVATGPRPVLDEAFRAGKADLLTMHSGDITTNLVADGYGTNMRPWTRNDLVIVGPESDPAGIAGMRDGAAALRRIAETESNFVDLDYAGGREMAHVLWKRSGIKPQGAWLLQDGSKGDHQQLRFAQEHNAYLIVGRMPVINGKLARAERMKILVDQDPTMRRPYNVMEANPEKVAGANSAGARALSDFLLSDETQKFLLTYTTQVYTQQPGVPLFYPVRQVAKPRSK